MADGDGIDTLAPVRAAHPALPVIVLSAQNTLDTAVRATETGGVRVFPQAVRSRRTGARGAARRRAQARDGPPLADESGEGLPLVGRSRAMQDVYRMITRVLRNDLTVLILGESGTGKELVAEAIHQLGHRKVGSVRRGQRRGHSLAS